MSGPSIDEILEDYRNAGVGGHLVGGGVLRALCAEIDRLREAKARAEATELERNRRLAEKIATGEAVPGLDKVIETVREMAAAYLDVPGPRAAQIADALAEAQAEINRLRERLAELERPTDATEVVDQQQFCDEMRFRGIGLGGSDGR